MFVFVRVGFIFFSLKYSDKSRDRGEEAAHNNVFVPQYVSCYYINIIFDIIVMSVRIQCVFFLFASLYGPQPPSENQRQTHRMSSCMFSDIFVIVVDIWMSRDIMAFLCVHTPCVMESVMYICGLYFVCIRSEPLESTIGLCLRHIFQLFTLADINLRMYKIKKIIILYRLRYYRSVQFNVITLFTNEIYQNLFINLPVYNGPRVLLI